MVRLPGVGAGRGGVLGLALAGFVILLAYPNLPSIEALTEYQPKIPLRVYTADGLLIGSSAKSAARSSASRRFLL